MKRIGVLTSGGDAPGMNAAIRAVVRTALQHGMSVVGFKRGYNGLLMRSPIQTDDFEILTSRSVSDKIHRGGTFLRTARCKEFEDLSVQKQAVSNLRALGIEGLVCIGGDGTLRGAEALNNLGMATIGVPGTIDNDLSYTDYTIGFDTALNTACDCLNKIRETSDSHERASLLTVMGRNCGDIALHTAVICGAEVCMIPEIKWDIVEVAHLVKFGVLRGKRSMILVFAEGALSSLTTDINALCSQHPALTKILPHGAIVSSSEVAEVIEYLSGHDTRSTVLGYIQRGGSPSARDRWLATRLGAHAADLLAEDRGGLAVGVRGPELIEAPFTDVQKGPHRANLGLEKLVDIMAYISR
ncbi:MAG: ATP-dependent 6-phosphofructokinase [Christensenellales bacterium]|nr:ATP-dependent 6-phosphofructokinase [Christensenellales bacterium]